MGKTMRDDFEEAFKQHEVEDQEPATETPAEDQPAAEAAADTPQETDEKSDPTEAAAEAKAPNEAVAGQNDVAKDEQADESADKDEQRADVKAPAGWTPAAREHWAKLPTEVQEMVSKREKQINDALNQGSENRKTGERFMDIASKYQPILDAEGVKDPVEGYRGIMNAIAGLRMGSARQKAMIIANLVGNYGVDVGELDGVLAQQMGAPPTEQDTSNQQLEKMLAEKLEPIQQFMSKAEQARERQKTEAEERVNAELEAFAADPKHEFFEDVKMQMADLIDMAAKSGRSLTLDDAYTAACQANPEIRRVLAGRVYETNIEQKREAASSVRGTQTAGGQAAPESLRDAISQAWDG